MDFTTYQRRTRDTAKYPQRESLNYLICGLAGESGEVAQEVKRFITSNRVDKDKLASRLKDELGDVIWYVAQLCECLDLSLDEVAAQNLHKLRERHNPRMEKHYSG